MSITVESITKVYGRQKALDDVSLNIRSGEIVGLLGPNGAGKSTLMKILTCFIPPTSGAATVSGFDIREESIEVRKTTGYLPENNPLYLEMYVKEYLEFVSGIHHLENSKQKVKDMIFTTGLEVEQNKKIGALSKGFRQRVGLAQAMIHDPEVLILDEPTSGLDPNQLLEIRSLIKKLGKEKTVMLSTHIMQEVEAVCDRAVIINEGKIVADDSTDRLSQMAKGKQLIKVEFDQPVDIKKLQKMPDVAEIVHDSGNTYLIHTRGEKDLRSDIFEFAVRNKIKVLSLQKEQQSLEEVFQELTGRK